MLNAERIAELKARKFDFIDMGCSNGSSMKFATKKLQGIPDSSFKELLVIINLKERKGFGSWLAQKERRLRVTPENNLLGLSYSDGVISAD